MARLPITLVEASSKGAVSLVFGADFHVADNTGKIVASTVDGLDGQVVKIEGSNKGNIRAAAFSRDGALLAICTIDKGLYIYETEHWTTVRSLLTEKRTNALAFDPQGEFLATADKFGDAYKVSTSPGAQEKPQLLLGHVSILCAIDFSFHERPFVLTCDRDEKLRVSKYPNAYNIQSFGLGHTEFVTTVATGRFALASAVTGSGDGTLRLWDLASGALVQTVELSEHLAQYYASGRAICSENTYVDRTAANERYGVLRVRAVDALEAFVAVVERIPAVLVFPVRQGKLDKPQIIDIAQPPTDIAVMGDRLIVSYTPVAGKDDLVVALKPSGEQYVLDDELTAAMASSIATKDAETVPALQSIFVWGNKMYLDRPKGEGEGEDNDGED